VLVELGVVEQRYRAVLEVLGLADRSSRPASCPHQMPAAVEARIVAMRLDHPGWGPSRIRWELERAGVRPLPGRSAVYRALIHRRSAALSPTSGKGR
jgi:hypothetical protein